MLAQHVFGFEGTVALQIFMVGFAGIALLAALFVRLPLMIWLVVGILFFSSLTAPIAPGGLDYIRTWMFPVQTLRADIHLGLGIILTLLVFLRGSINVHWLGLQGFFMLAISIFAGLMQFIHWTALDAVQSLGFAAATIPSVLIAIAVTCRDHEGCLRMLRGIMWMSVAWTFCCSVQFVINPQFLVNNTGRFWGMLGNAQQAAVLTAPCAIVAIWLFMNDPQRRLRLLWLALIGINLLFLGWSGSRTGLLMFLVGAMFILYNRLGKLILFAPIIIAMTFGLSILADALQIGNNLDRLTSSDDTRGWVWQAQMAKIAEKPLIGHGWLDTGGSESSWLGGWAGYGIVMFLLLISFLFGSMWLCFKLWTKRSLLPANERSLIDLFIAFNAMYFAAATFEGIMLGRSSTAQSLMLIFAGIGLYLIKATQREQPEDHRRAESEFDHEFVEYDPYLAYSYEHPRPQD